MAEEKIIEACPTLQSFFQMEVEDAMRHQTGQINSHIAFYLVNLLSHFSNPDHIYRHEDGSEIPLAFLYCRAQQESPEVKSRMLRYLGDFSLFISGFFQESLNRKLVDIDYYRSMGESAYHQLSVMDVVQRKQALLGQLFSQLSERFASWSDILSEVSEKSQLNTHSDILRLYEKWAKTGSQRTRELLIQKGIHPIEGMSTQFVN